MVALIILYPIWVGIVIPACHGLMKLMGW